MRRCLVIVLLALGACSPVPTESAPQRTPINSPMASPTPTILEPTTTPSSPPTTSRFDVENRSRAGVVVGAATDVGASMVGFEPGQQGTITILLINPQNGVSVEVQGGDGGCQGLGSGDFPTPAPFTLLIVDGVGPGTVKLSTVAGAASTPLPLPSNSLIGCGG